MENLKLNLLERLALKFQTGLDIKPAAPGDFTQKIRMLDRHTIVLDAISDGRVETDRGQISRDLDFFEACVDNIEDFFEGEDDVWNLSLSLVGVIASSNRALGGSYDHAADRARVRLREAVQKIDRWNERYKFVGDNALPDRISIPE